MQYRRDRQLKKMKTSQNVTLFGVTISFLVNSLGLFISSSIFSLGLTSAFAAASSSGAVLPAPPTNQSSTSANPNLDKTKNSSSISAGFLMTVARNTSLYDHQDGTRKDSLDLLLNPTLSWASNTLSVKTIYTRDLKDNSASDWSDTSVALLRPLKKWISNSGSSQTWGLSLGAGLPTSKDSSKRQSLLSTTTVGTSLTFAPADPQYGLTVVLGISAIKLFHRYDTALDGKVNNSYGSNQSLLVNLQNGPWSLSGEFIHKVRISYQNNNKNSFEHTEELGFAINQNLQVAVGHSNSGVANKANGETNIEFIDRNESQVYGSLTLSY